MPTSITIRNVPDETRDALAARAALSGRSLQEYLRGQLVLLARKPDAQVLAAQIRARKARTGSRLDPERLLALRNSDRK